MSLVFSDLATAGYHTPGHPEAPFRVLKTHERLKAAGHSLSKPSAPATEADVLLVHTQKHLAAVKTGAYSDADTPYYKETPEIALISLSGAIAAAAAAVAGKPAFSLMRPPGHHAAKERVAGFCYYNNLAIACEKAKLESALGRIAILDIDVHHGDGTQDIVLGKDDVLFCSLHQIPLYPGTGARSEKNCRNFPLSPGTGETTYLKTLENALLSIQDFKPALLAVSAGFDTYKECPIAGLKLDKETYRRIGRMIGESGLRRFAVLEGGYAEALPLLVENFIDGFFR